MCLCLKYLVRSSKWGVDLGVWEVVFFPVPEKIVYSFLRFPFWYILEKRIWFTIIFLPLKESLTLFQMWIILLYHHLFCPIWSYWEYQNELPKWRSSILMEIVTIPVVLVNQFYFYIHQPMRDWLFEKIVFQLDYHWASLSLHFHIVLK